MVDSESSPAPIVLIDDMEDDTYFAERLLREADELAPIVKFGSPIEAVASLDDLESQRTRPLMWLVDVRMPSVSGFDVVAEIRRRRALDSVPIVMLSGSDDPRDIERAKGVGADCYLKKFPSVQHMQEVLACARTFKPHDTGPRPDFSVGCNLLFTPAG